MNCPNQALNPGSHKVNSDTRPLDHRVDQTCSGNIFRMMGILAKFKNDGIVYFQFSTGEIRINKDCHAFIPKCETDLEQGHQRLVNGTIKHINPNMDPINYVTGGPSIYKWVKNIRVYGIGQVMFFKKPENLFILISLIQEMNQR